MNTEVELPAIMTDSDISATLSEETVSALEAAESAAPQFVRWFREVAPTSTRLGAKHLWWHSAESWCKPTH